MASAGVQGPAARFVGADAVLLCDPILILTLIFPPLYPGLSGRLRHPAYYARC